LTSSARLLLAGALLLAAAGPAWPHSLLLDSTPAANAVLAAPPPRVALVFNGRIEKRLSGIRIVPKAGEAKPLAADAGGAPDRLEAPLPPLEPGEYRLEWHVLSTDGHLVTGGFPFRIAP
jgi:methionine-rich copper-binding protein CopC